MSLAVGQSDRCGVHARHSQVRTGGGGHHIVLGRQDCQQGRDGQGELKKPGPLGLRLLEGLRGPAFRLAQQMDVKAGVKRRRRGSSCAS